MSPATALAFALALAAEPAPPASAGAPAPAAAEARWTLADAVQAFLRNNPDIAEARARIGEARADKITAGLVPNPEASTSIGNFPLRTNPPPTGNGAGITNNVVVGLGVQQTFELGRKRQKRVAVAEGNIAAVSADHDEVIRARLFDLKTAFYRALLAQARYELARAELEGYDSTIKKSKTRFEAGDISGGEFNKIELESVKYRNAIEQNRVDMLGAKADLMRLVGPGAPAAIALVGELAPSKEERADFDLGQLTQRALAERSDIIGARRRLDAAAAQLRLAEAQRIPDLTVGLGYTHSQATQSGDNPDTVGTTLSVPLPVFSRNQGEIAKAHVAIGAAEHALAAAEQAARVDVEAAVRRFEVARAVAGRFEGGFLQKAQDVRSIIEKGYLGGGFSILEFLEAVRTEIDTRADYLDSLFQLRSSLLEIDRAVGGDARARSPSS